MEEKAGITGEDVVIKILFHQSIPRHAPAKNNIF